MSDTDRRTRVGNVTNGFAYEEPLLFERSRSGRDGCSLPVLDVPEVRPEDVIPEDALRDDLPELPESTSSWETSKPRSVSAW